MSTHNLCFEQKYEKYQSFLPEKFRFLAVKFTIYLNRRVFVMKIYIMIWIHFLAEAVRSPFSRTSKLKFLLVLSLAWYSHSVEGKYVL